MAVSELVRSTFHRTPVNRHLKFNLEDRTENGALVSMMPLDEFIQERGVIHGGIISTLADTAAVYILHPDLASGQTMASIEFKINFLRPAVRERGKLLARSKLVRKGKNVALCEVEVYQKDLLIAKGLFTYLVYDEMS